ncbi:hypothetical protein SAMN05444413_101505 [Roseivivax marinus]|uniref:hypothetical protein n=1 Tax=Roseivivax marinus TaxID=1379903 RepID=UPI0008C70F45|nr:hypothetical protein [Roseivivax marinus]SEK40109.1 hypothetical protein SAMN05444413_101505 [Roseivivax marinus]
MDTEEQRKLHRLFQRTTRELVEETARLQARPYRSTVIAMAICIPLGLCVAFGLILIDRLL